MYRKHRNDKENTHTHIYLYRVQYNIYRLSLISQPLDVDI